MCKKVNFSISQNVDDYLSHTKTESGLSKSQILTLLVTKYGDKLAKDLSKYSQKEETVKRSISLCM